MQDPTQSFIYNLWLRSEVPLQSLVDAMICQYGHKQTKAIVGSKVLSFDQLNAMLFYSKCQDDIEITRTVKLMACEVAETIIKEHQDPRKAT